MGGGWLGRKVADGATAAVVSEDSEGFSWRMCDDFERELRTETVRVTELKGEAETKESRLARIDKENDAKRQVLREIAECIAVHPPPITHPLPLPDTSAVAVASTRI